MEPKKEKWTERLVKRWDSRLVGLLRDKPGRRFVRYYRHHREQAHSPWTRVWQITLGWLLIIAGIVLWLTPAAPGLFLTIPGTALLCIQSRKLSRFMDRTELGIRNMSQWLRRKMKRARKDE